MNNLPFVLWLLGWPLVLSATKFLDAKTFGKIATASSFEIILYLTLWAGIAILVYVPQ